jgi:hypothetical protein
MVIIPERSKKSSFTAKCLDDWRFRNERMALKKPNPYIPVVPRFFKRSYLIDVVNSLNKELLRIVSHEDSILYYEVYKRTKNIAFSRKYIYNDDPPLLPLLKKAFHYGRNHKEITSSGIPTEILDLINRLNMNTFNFKELGIGKGYLIQVLRGIAFELGTSL